MEGTTLTYIGLAYDGLGEKQKALDYYGQALPRFRAASDPDQVKQLGDQLGRFVFGE